MNVFYLMYGRKSVLPIDAAINQKISSKYVDAEDYAKLMENNFAIAWKIAKLIERAQRHQKKQYDQRAHVEQLKINDIVSLYNAVIHVGKSQKLISKWIGTLFLRPHNVDIVDIRKKNAQLIRVNANRIKKFRYGLESEVSDED